MSKKYVFPRKKVGELEFKVVRNNELMPVDPFEIEPGEIFDWKDTNKIGPFKLINKFERNHDFLWCFADEKLCGIVPERKTMIPEPEPEVFWDPPVSDYFGLSHSSWLTLPRVLMESMPHDWQQKMTDLLFEYEATFNLEPQCLGTTVRTTYQGKIVKTPDWLKNYRHPDKEFIETLKRK